MYLTQKGFNTLVVYLLFGCHKLYCGLFQLWLVVSSAFGMLGGLQAGILNQGRIPLLESPFVLSVVNHVQIWECSSCASQPES